MLIPRTNLSPRGWVLYDGTCHFCRTTAQRYKNQLRHRGFQLDTLQSNFGKQFLTPGTDEMKVITPTNQVLGGAQAIAYLANFFWYAKPLTWLWRCKVTRRWMEHRYRQIAQRRHCTPGAGRSTRERWGGELHPRNPKQARNDFDRWF